MEGPRRPESSVLPGEGDTVLRDFALEAQRSPPPGEDVYESYEIIEALYLRGATNSAPQTSSPPSAHASPPAAECPPPSAHASPPAAECPPSAHASPLAECPPPPAVANFFSHDSISKGGTDDAPREEALTKSKNPLLAALANGYEKRSRHRHGKIPEKREVKADRVSALEESLSRFDKRKTGAIVCPEICMNFDSINEAYEFYNIYSWEFGFGIRHGRNRFNKQGSITMQEFVCSCAGKPKNENSTSVRCSCPALMRLLRTEDGGYFVKALGTKHNHNLSETYGETRHWPSHKHIDGSTSFLIAELRKHNIAPSQVYSILGGLFGRMDDVPFTKKSLRNLCSKISREHANNDVNKTISMFSKMALEDPEFTFRVRSDSESRMDILLWTTGRSRMQYKYFGDVVTFDTTYKTNMYLMPFGMFVGVNNHFQTIMFGGVLMRSETMDAFEWVFSEFLDLMGGNPPQTILTDQCTAMEGAIKSVFPSTAHRWCKWHVFLKAKENLGELIDNKLFMDEFERIVHHSLSIDEFQTNWSDLINKHSLHNHEWLSRLYGSREKWASPFFINIFCADQISTQRSESANHALKKYVNSSCPMNVFVEQYHKLLSDRHEQESLEDNKTNIARVARRTSHPLESHATKVYTRAMFKKFGEIYFHCDKYKIETVEADAIYKARHRDYGEGSKWSNLSYEVSVNETKDFFVCQCGLFPHMGMLCCHILKVMRFMGVEKIPKDHIMKRWTPNARDILPKDLVEYQKDQRGLHNRSARHSHLFITALEVVELAKKDHCSFDFVHEGFKAMKAKLSPCDKRGREGPILVREPLKKKGRQEPVPKQHEFCQHCNSIGHLPVNCPNIPPGRKKSKKTNTKENPRKPSTCGNCGLIGHTATSCPNISKSLEKNFLNEMG